MARDAVMRAAAIVADLENMLLRRLLLIESKACASMRDWVGGVDVAECAECDVLDQKFTRQMVVAWEGPRAQCSCSCGSGGETRSQWEMTIHAEATPHPDRGEAPSALEGQMSSLIPLPSSSPVKPACCCRLPIKPIQLLIISAKTFSFSHPKIKQENVWKV